MQCKTIKQVDTLVISPDGSKFDVNGGLSDSLNNIRIYCAVTGRQLSSISAGSDIIRGFSFAEGGQYLTLAKCPLRGQGLVFQMIDTISGTITHTATCLDMQDRYYTSQEAFAPNGTHVLATNQSSMILVSIVSDSAITLPQASACMNIVSWQPGSQKCVCLLANDVDPSMDHMKCLDVVSHQVMRFPDNTFSIRICFSPDGRWLVCSKAATLLKTLSGTDHQYLYGMSVAPPVMALLGDSLHYHMQFSANGLRAACHDNALDCRSV